MEEVVKSVIGSFDGVEYTLIQTKDGQWQTNIDIDFNDGCYATVIKAETYSGKIGFWHGILYVANGFSHLHITEEKMSLWLLPEKQLIAGLLPERFELVLKKECDYHGS